jgi:hypothetical protein
MANLVVTETWTCSLYKTYRNEYADTKGNTLLKMLNLSVFFLAGNHKAKLYETGQGTTKDVPTKVRPWLHDVSKPRSLD